MSDVHTPAPEEVSAALGRVLTQLRRNAGVTQVELARAVGVDQTAVSRWEHAKDVFPAVLIPMMEATLDVPHGTMWAAAGLLNVTPVAQAIYADESLDAREKRFLVTTYEGLVGRRSGASGGSGRGGR